MGSREQAKMARQASQKPDTLETFRVIPGVGEVLEKAPLSQAQYDVWPLRQAGEFRPVDAIHTRAREHHEDLGQKSRYHIDFGPQTKEAHPLAKPRNLPRGASLIMPGGAKLRLNHLADRQADYLTATKSFSRGYVGAPSQGTLRSHVDARRTA